MPFWWFDCGALLVLLQLAAADERLATGFYSPAPPEELAALAAIVELPGDVALAGVLTLGYAADDAAVPGAALARRRKPAEDLVTWLRT